jgi:hypothetical protein
MTESNKSTDFLDTCEFLGERDYDLYLFSDFIRTEGTKEWYHERYPEIPAEWCELFELHSLHGGVENEEVKRILEEKKQEQEAINKMNMKILEGDEETLEQAFLENFDFNYKSDLNILNELYHDRQPSDILRQRSGGHQTQRDQKFESDILFEGKDSTAPKSD